MIKLKLKNALSYSGVVSATVKDPFVEVKDESVAEAAVKTGYFEVAERNQVPDDSAGSASGDEDKHTKSSIKKLSADEQRALIEELEGDPEETSNEEERIALILELQGE